MVISHQLGRQSVVISHQLGRQSVVISHPLETIRHTSEAVSGHQTYLGSTTRASAGRSDACSRPLRSKQSSHTCGIWRRGEHTCTQQVPSFTRHASTCPVPAFKGPQWAINGQSRGNHQKRKLVPSPVVDARHQGQSMANQGAITRNASSCPVP